MCVPLSNRLCCSCWATTTGLRFVMRRRPVVFLRQRRYRSTARQVGLPVKQLCWWRGLGSSMSRTSCLAAFEELTRLSGLGYDEILCC